MKAGGEAEDDWSWRRGGGRSGVSPKAGGKSGRGKVVSVAGKGSERMYGWGGVVGLRGGSEGIEGVKGGVGGGGWVTWALGWSGCVAWVGWDVLVGVVELAFLLAVGEWVGVALGWGIGVEIGRVGEELGDGGMWRGWDVWVDYERGWGLGLKGVAGCGGGSRWEGYWACWGGQHDLLIDECGWGGERDGVGGVDGVQQGRGAVGGLGKGLEGWMEEGLGLARGGDLQGRAEWWGEVRRLWSVSGRLARVAVVACVEGGVAVHGGVGVDMEGGLVGFWAACGGGDLACQCCGGSFGGEGVVGEVWRGGGLCKVLVGARRIWAVGRSCVGGGTVGGRRMVGGWSGGFRGGGGLRECGPGGGARMGSRVCGGGARGGASEWTGEGDVRHGLNMGCDGGGDGAGVGEEGWWGDVLGVVGGVMVGVGLVSLLSWVGRELICGVGVFGMGGGGGVVGRRGTDSWVVDGSRRCLGVGVCGGAGAGLWVSGGRRLVVCCRVGWGLGEECGGGSLLGRTLLLGLWGRWFCLRGALGLGLFLEGAAAAFWVKWSGDGGGSGYRDAGGGWDEAVGSLVGGRGRISEESGVEFGRGCAGRVGGVVECEWRRCGSWGRGGGVGVAVEGE
ncbi:hypothetical protein Tco_1490680 [Tanacetum coccineum]